MKKFLLSIVALIVLSAPVLAAPIVTSPTVTVEDTALDAARRKALESSVPIETLGPAADRLAAFLENAVAELRDKNINVMELRAMAVKIVEKRDRARATFLQAGIAGSTGDSLAIQAERTHDRTESIKLRTRAIASYDEATRLVEKTIGLLKQVAEFGKEAEVLINTLMPDDTLDRVAGRYHSRKRVERFFTRSCRV